MRPKTPRDPLEFFQLTFSIINKFWLKWLILSYNVFQCTFHKFPRIYWLKFEQWPYFLSEHLSVKFMEQVYKSAKGRFWLEIIQSVKQLFWRRQIFDDHLQKFNTENSVWSHFILIGSNKITRGKLLFMLSSGGCFTEVTTFFKSYWKHC